MLLMCFGRVAGGCYHPRAPSEPCVRLSPHTAQAPGKVSLVGIPADLHPLHVTGRLSEIAKGTRGAPASRAVICFPRFHLIPPVFT